MNKNGAFKKLRSFNYCEDFCFQALDLATEMLGNDLTYVVHRMKQPFDHVVLVSTDKRGVSMTDKFRLPNRDGYPKAGPITLAATHD